MAFLNVGLLPILKRSSATGFFLVIIIDERNDSTEIKLYQPFSTGLLKQES